MIQIENPKNETEMKSDGTYLFFFCYLFRLNRGKMQGYIVNSALSSFVFQILYRECFTGRRIGRMTKDRSDEGQIKGPKKERNQKIALNALEKIQKWEQELKCSIGSAA